ncbi:MAG: hypothetical protein WA996_07600, partial [Candidatus Promineifilaceae bacterium]
ISSAKMELQAVTGQLHIVNGAIQQNPSVPGLLAQTAPSRPVRGRESDFLFVHVTLSGPVIEKDPLLDDIVDSIGSRFYRTSGSVTAALRQAIIETNGRLLDYNLNGADRLREGAITCAVQRRDELYVAQVGEAIALVGHNFGIERLPVSSVDQPTPFGRSAGVDIRYYHNWLQSGDMLLLADPRLSHLPVDRLRPVLVNGDVEQGTAELASIIGPDSSRIMLIEFTEDAPSYLPDALPDSPVNVSGRRLPPPMSEPQREGRQPTPIPYRARAKSHISQVDVEVVETSARIATSEAAKGLSRITAWLADVLTRLRPPRKESQEYGGWAMPMFLAVGIPLAVALVVAGVYFQRGSVVEISDLRSTMRDNLYLARQSSDDPEVMLDYYNEVLRLATDAEELRPGDSEVARIRGEALAELDRMDGVARLNAIPLQVYPKGTKLSAIDLGDPLNGELFVLDKGNNLVYLHRTSENYQGIEESTPEVILSSEQTVGNQIVGEIVDIMWRPRGNDVSRDGLAMLDKAGVLFSYHPNLADTRAVPLGFAIDWLSPSSITSYFERLYILDNGAGEIWRYLPDGDGFILQEDEKSIQFDEDIDIEHVVDLAIHSEDGSVLLLYDDGRIRRYANRRMLWDEKSLFESGMSTQLVEPVTVKFVGRGLSSSIYVLDPGSDRLVQISLGGTFLAQFKVEDADGAELLGRASDFVVASDPNRVFIVAENTLYQATQFK